MAALLARVIWSQRNANRARVALACAALLLIALPLLQAPTGRAQEVPELGINSQAYIVIDAATGEVYAQRNADDRRAMASLTKVFTFIEAINRAPLDASILITTDDIYEDTSTRVGFSPGETFSLQDLLYGMMLPSGNDAAHAIARGIGEQPGDANGDVGYERFVGWMNARVQAMGLENTSLINPHGWGVPGHYSTAADLAAFVRYAILFPEFLSVTGTQSYTTANGYSFTNTNKLLTSYQFLVGGKTGYDDDAGYCLIEVAQRDGSTMISVTLDGIAPDDWYDDNRVLLEYAFDQKAARLAAGEPITGDVVSFVDPGIVFLAGASSNVDLYPAGAAATREATSTSVADLADATPTPPIAVPAASPSPDIGTLEDADGEERARGPSIVPPGLGRTLLVAGVVALAFALLRGLDTTRRGHRRVERRILAAREAAAARGDTSDGDAVLPEEDAPDAGDDAAVDRSLSTERSRRAAEPTGAGDAAPPETLAPRRRGGLAARFAPRDPIVLPSIGDQDDGSENAPPEEPISRPASRRVFEPPPAILSPTSTIPISEIPVPPAPPPAAFESPLLQDIVPQPLEPAGEPGDQDAALLESLAVADAEPTADQPDALAADLQAIDPEEPPALAQTDDVAVPGEGDPTQIGFEHAAIDDERASADPAGEDLPARDPERDGWPD